MLLPRQAIIDEFPSTRILCNVKTSATWFDRNVTRNRQPLSRSPILFISSRSYYILADIDGVPLAPREIGKVCRRNSIGVALRTAGIRIRTVVARERGRGEGAGSTTQGGKSRQQRGKYAARDVYHTLLPLLSSLIVRPSVLFPVLIWTPALPSRCLPSYPRSLSPEWRANEVGTLSFSVSLSYPDALNAAARSAPIFISRAGEGEGRMHRGRSSRMTAGGGCVKINCNNRGIIWDYKSTLLSTFASCKFMSIWLKHYRVFHRQLSPIVIGFFFWN